MTNKEIIKDFKENYDERIAVKKENNIPYTEEEEEKIMEFVNAFVHESRQKKIKAVQR